MADAVPLLKTVADGLAFHTVDELKKLLNLLPIQPSGTRKAELIDAISTQLTGKSLKTLWKSLDDIQQAAVAEAVHNTHGHHDGEAFLAKYGQAPDWGSRDTYSYAREPSKLRLFFLSTGMYSRVVYLPVEMQTELKAYVPKPKALALDRSDQPPEELTVERRYYDFERRTLIQETVEVPITAYETERLAQQELAAVLRLVHLGRVSVSDKTYMPTKATLKAIAEVLPGGDYYAEADDPETDQNRPPSDPIGAIKPFAWPMLLQAAKLVTLEGKKLKLTKAGQKALTADPAKTIQSIWKKWLKTTLLDELRRVDSIKGQTGKGKRGLTAVSSRRGAIVTALTQCPVGQWVLFKDLERFLIASHQTFTVSRNPENLYISEPGYGNLYDTVGVWSILEGSYLRCLLFEYAATLGLLDIAFVPPYDAPGGDWQSFWGADDLSFLSRYDGLIAFRLTPLGAFCLGLTPDYDAPEITADTTLRVLPNLDIVLMGAPLQPAERLMMDTFTLQTSDAVWKLDRDQALKATAEGHDLKAFQTFLTEASADALPQPVKQFFKDCLSRSTSLQDRGLARLIECKEASLATLIANDSRTKKYCYLAGDRHLVMPTDQETRFRSGLRKLGYSLPLS
ncbi:MAG: hypothetical protein AAFR42_06960 [Cyanobacteria bacterium J06628_6]